VSSCSAREILTLAECLGVDVPDPNVLSSEVRCVGLLAIAGSVPTPEEPPPVDAANESGAVGGAEIFRPITGGAGRPMLRMKVLIWSERRAGCVSMTTELSLKMSK